jgi:hypothetical protein
MHIPMYTKRVLDMTGFIAPYIFTQQFLIYTLQFTVTHALGFLVFTSRIMATDLSQSHCKFT